MALLYGNMNDYLAGGAQLEQLYGNPVMGFSIKKLAKKTVKVTKAVAKPVAKVVKPVAKATVSVVKKTPAATITRAAVNVAKKPTLTNITRQVVNVAKVSPVAQAAKVVAKPVAKAVVKAAPVVARNVAPVTRAVVKAAPVVARNVMKSPLVKTAVASAIPGGAAAMSVYDRLTAAKKVLAPKPATRVAPKPAPKQRVFTQKRAPTPPPRQRAPKPVTPAPAPVAPAQSVFEQHKIPIMIGGTVLLVGGLGAILLAKKSK